MSDSIEKLQPHPWIIVDSISGIPQLMPRERDGYVYFVQYGEFVKIGMTRDIFRRMSDLFSSAKNYAGKPIGKVAYTIPHQRYRQNERALHKHFAAQRVRGELFNIVFEHTKWHKIPVNMTEITVKRETDRAEYQEHIENLNDRINAMNAQIIESTAKLKEAAESILKKMPYRALTYEELEAMPDDDLVNKVLFPVKVLAEVIGQ